MLDVVQCRDVPLRFYRAERAFECPRHRRKCHQPRPEPVRGNREPARSIVAFIGGARDTEEVLQHVRLQLTDRKVTSCQSWREIENAALQYRYNWICCPGRLQ